jgi:hypothetical protein
MKSLSHVFSRLRALMDQSFRNAAQNYTDIRRSQAQPAFWDRVSFAARLASLEEAPEPLRGAMFAALKPGDVIRYLVFGPSQRTAASASPASLLAISERGWIVALREDSGLRACRGKFTETLRVEITEVLLYGRLRLDFVKNGQIQSVIIFFNTVACEVYEEAVQLLLTGSNARHRSIVDKYDKVHSSLASLPLKFQNAIARHLPTGEQVLEIIYWPAVLGRLFLIFQRELWPGSLVALTDGHLLLFSEEKVLSKGKSKIRSSYGYSITYYPLSRIVGINIMENRSSQAIELDICAHQCGEKLKIAFPGEKRSAVAAFVEAVVSSLRDVS